MAVNLPPKTETMASMAKAFDLAENDTGSPEIQIALLSERIDHLTEQRELLASVLHGRATAGGSHITIGAEHDAPELSGLTIITATYQLDQVEGVVGVIGPTRMPYEKVLAVVECTSSLVSNLVTH